MVGRRGVRAHTLIVSTGASAKWLGIPGEDRLRGRGVSSCATCDGFFFRGQPLVVVRGGDTAMEEATFLTRFATKVTVVHRRDELRASQIVQDRAFANDKIDFVWNSVVDEIVGDGAVEKAVLKDVNTDETREVETAEVFVAIGHTPNTQLFEGQLEMDAGGYILVEADHEDERAGRVRGR